MPVKSSGTLSFNTDIVGEFGGTAPHSLSEYYGVDTGVPSSGTIAFSDFYGASDVPAPTPSTYYVQNSSATGNISQVGSWTANFLGNWGYQQSGTAWTFNSIAQGNITVQSTISPQGSWARSNSGDDRGIILRRNGSNITSAYTSAFRTTSINTTISISPGDVITLYVDNSMDWRYLGSSGELVYNVNIIGA